MRKNKLLLLLALLLTAATGAWADETLLLTIESRDYKTFKSGSKTFDDKVTVTFSNSVQNDGDNWGWYANSSASLLTVAGINGYTITSCKFYVEINGDAMTGYTIKGESPSVYLNNLNVYTDNSQSVKIGKNGVTKIEVYEAAAPAGYTVSLKDGVKDADKWTITPTEATTTGVAENTEVTLKYNGRLKVKSVTATSDAEQSAKPAATVTTAPTGAAIVGVGKTTALVSGGVADGGTLWYAVTTTNTKPTSTAGFSDAVPTAETITASGTVYVWYYVKADDTHSDSEIAATAIEVPVADIVWDVTNVSDLEVWGDFSPYTKEGVTLSGNSENVQVLYDNYGDPETDGIVFEAFGSGGFTFTAPTGKAFTKIEMKAVGIAGWDGANLGTGWAYNNTTVTWKGTAAASTVGLLTDADMFSGEPIISIVFYLSE
jgi:hypothetical protein